MAANDVLRAARQRTASLTSPDVGLSRQELADLVNTWVWDHHDKTVEHSANWVGQLERGKIRWPGKVSREALRAILGVATDAALGFVNDRSARAAVKLEAVDRQQFISSGLRLGVGALVLEGPVVALLKVSEPTPIPRRIGATEEVGAHEDARRVFRFALACAEKAEDWLLRAYVLDSMGLQEIRTGRPDEKLTLAEQGLVRADRLTETVLSMLHTTRGRALAKMRRVNETLTAIGTAEDHFARSTPANDPPLLANWNAAFLAGNTGQALFDLAILDHNPARPPTDSPRQPPGTPPATPAPGRSA